ncbi:MAG: hypothetical protein DRJ50_09565 [Actinobacteria bacterium]|nr:MAG: hypothetical protein DRJ50_09565 [Actinomycetota bacterium]
MFSATGLVAAFAVLALSVNTVNPSHASPPGVPAGSPYTVDAGGTGDFSTIGEAVAAASDGDTVFVQPGTYTEAIVIDKDITLAGDGPVDEIIIVAPADPPEAFMGDRSFTSPNFESYAVLISGSDALVTGLTFQGVDTSVIVEGGSPNLRDLVFDGAGRPFSGTEGEPGQYELVITSGSSAHIADNTMIGGAGITVGDRSNPIIEGNSIRGAGDSGIQAASAISHHPTIRDNDISGVRFGIQMSGGMPGGKAHEAGGMPVISGNDVSAELVGISLGESDAVVYDNTVRDSLNGIVLSGGGSAEVMGNTVEVTGYGIDIGVYASPIVDGNTVCGGTVSIKVHDTANPKIGENTTCEAA